ncbi:MAG: hypothetical protein ACNA8L_13620 [Luteolibacter sp.]
MPGNRVHILGVRQQNAIIMICGLVLTGLMVVAFLQAARSKVMEDESRADHESRSKQGHDQGSRVTAASTKERELITRNEAARLLLLLDHARGYEMVLLQARLSAIFKDWGRVDIDAAERFLSEEDIAQGPHDGSRKYQEDLILAAWIGLAEVDPAEAWGRYVGMWKNRKGEWVIDASWRSTPYDTAGYHLFRAYHAHDPAAALRWLRNRKADHSPPIGGIIWALMSATSDSETRRRYYIEFCAEWITCQTSLGLICAGVAEHDPGQAWEFVQWGNRKNDDFSASHSPEEIADRMIHFWAMAQPEPTLDFMVLPEHEAHLPRWIGTFTWVVRGHRPDLVIRALEKNEFAGLRKRFSMASFVPTMVEFGSEWPLVVEDIPPSPEERIHMVREALENSELPDSLTIDFLEAIRILLNPTGP